MADMNMKIKGLKLLVQNGILTESECELCIGVLSGERTSVAVTGRPSSAVAGADYEDNKISIKFKGIRRISNLFFGDGFEFKFVIQNKTGHEMRVSATEVTVNGFVVSNNELINSEAAANKKTLDSIYLYDKKMNGCDIYGIDDIEEFEFKIKYEIEDIDYEYESESVSVTPFEA